MGVEKEFSNTSFNVFILSHTINKKAALARSFSKKLIWLVTNK
jgi:hypothetical protein